MCLTCEEVSLHPRSLGRQVEDKIMPKFHRTETTAVILGHQRPASTMALQKSESSPMLTAINRASLHAISRLPLQNKVRESTPGR